MSEVEQLAQEQFNTFKTRLCEILCEIEEEHKSAFIQGYAKGETDEKFRTVQVVSKHFVDLEKENAALKKACNETQELLDKQIETTYKVVEENNELKEKLNKATEILKVVLNKWKEERWILQSEKEVKMIENVMKEAEAFLQEN